MRRRVAAAAKPNPAHFALAKLEQSLGVPRNLERSILLLEIQPEEGDAGARLHMGWRA
jgi:hypothetical protein